ncbi:SirB2 family protein [Paucibacter sp. R3-3]|uniref:SirB2 family protein n=1 Tax=Roseateles agri TaxID=3098619 RepID=A0ABU5DKX7_9BURK|nr:SirB2 family protein [Paucibacter sp. R3-3]MDY0746946.1 SirB2 family protein [Paucibacter sp. R3-3]
MTYSFDAQMVQIHVLLAWLSVIIFLARGGAYQMDLRWAMDVRLRFIVLGIDILMTVTGLSLWVLEHLNPLNDGWLGTKLLALIVYVVAAHVAMWNTNPDDDEQAEVKPLPQEMRVPAYMVALLALAYMMGVSITRSAWLGLA